MHQAPCTLFIFLLDFIPHDHVTPAMRDLHWLPAEYRITYKLRLLMHHISIMGKHHLISLT